MGITLLDMLKNSGLINRDQFEEALRNRVVFGGKIGTSLIELGYVREEDLARFLSSKLAVPYVPPERLLSIPDDIINLIPRELALKYRVIPIYREKKRLYLVMADPADLTAIEEISFITGFVIKPLITPEVRLLQALGKYYQFHIDRRIQQIIEKIDQGREKAGAPGDAVSPESYPDVPPPIPSGSEEILEEAEVVDEEEWMERVGHYSIDSVSKELARADDREQIAETLMRYLGQEFDRVALLVIRGDTAYGWKCINRQQELKEFDRTALYLAAPSILKTVTGGRSYYLGSVPQNRLNNMLIEAIGGAPPATALFLPIVIAGRVVSILYIDGGDTELGERFSELQRLIAKAIIAFEILIFREKVLMI